MKDPYFNNIGLPANVFHAKTKHSDMDDLAQICCNLSCFNKLIRENDEWVFNSFTAKQAHSLFGDFQSIVREMPISKSV
jgi:hypothetical protein